MSFQGSIILLSKIHMINQHPRRLHYQYPDLGIAILELVSISHHTHYIVGSSVIF